jgi:hypothetical protein
MRDRNNSAPRLPHTNMMQARPISHKPRLSGAAGVARRERLRSQATYSARGGMSSPCDCCGSIQHERARLARIPPYSHPISAVTTTGPSQTQFVRLRANFSPLPSLSLMLIQSVPLAIWEPKVPYGALVGPELKHIIVPRRGSPIFR